MPTDSICIAMILLVRSCHHDQPARQVNQAADHLISRQIVHLPVNERGCPFSLRPSPPHKTSPLLLLSAVNSYRFLPPSDGGGGWWRRRGRWNLCNCRA